MRENVEREVWGYIRDVGAESGDSANTPEPTGDICVEHEGITTLRRQCRVDSYLEILVQGDGYTDATSVRAEHGDISAECMSS